MKQVLDARKKSLEVVTAEDLNIDDSKVGLKASPTQVDKIFAPPIKTGGEVIDGSDPIIAAKKLMNYLITNNYLKE